MFFGRSDHCHQWFYDVFLMMLPSLSMVFDGSGPLVNDAMVSMDRCGLSGSMSLQENAGPSPAKKKRTKTTEIQLENAPQDEVHINRAIFHWYSPRIISGFRRASRPDL